MLHPTHGVTGQRKWNRGRKWREKLEQPLMNPIFIQLLIYFHCNIQYWRAGRMLNC